MLNDLKKLLDLKINVGRGQSSKGFHDHRSEATGNVNRLVVRE